MRVVERAILNPTNPAQETVVADRKLTDRCSPAQTWVTALVPPVDGDSNELSAMPSWAKFSGYVIFA